jgi:mannose-6-phosphate isomerase-like protein (cupin superfamily)
MVRGDEVFAIHVGDTICIPPGTPHRVDNTGPTELKILCCCSPPYSHAETELLE